MKQKDIVTDILDRIEEVAKQFLANEMGFEQSAVDALTQQIRAQDGNIRRDWGKNEPYVAARSPEKEAAKRRALEEVRRSGNVAEASSKHGISRATMYRLLKR